MELKLKKIFEKIFRVKKINNFTIKNSKKWDSLSHLDLISSIEEEFNIKFNMQEITEINSYKICLKILKKKLK